MKHTHQIPDDINIDLNVNVDLPVEEVGDLVDKVTESIVVIIVVASAAHILRSWLV